MIDDTLSRSLVDDAVLDTRIAMMRVNQIQLVVVKIGVAGILTVLFQIMFIFWLAQMRAAGVIKDPPFTPLISFGFICSALALALYGMSWVRAEQRIHRLIK